MVTFVLDNQDDNKVVFLYYPENDRRKRAGVIQYDKGSKDIGIRRFADLDWFSELTADEIKEKREKGIKYFVDTTKESKIFAFYGSPALSEIHKQIDLGRLPLEGKVG